MIRNSNWTGRIPRDLNGAFGPHTSNDVQPMRQAPTRAERIADVLLAVAIGVFLVLFLVHYAMKGY